MTSEDIASYNCWETSPPPDYQGLPEVSCYIKAVFLVRAPPPSSSNFWIHLYLHGFDSPYEEVVKYIWEFEVLMHIMMDVRALLYI